MKLIYFIFKLESNNSTNGHHCKNECGQNGLFQGVQGYYSWCYIDEFESWDYCTPNQDQQGVKDLTRDRGMNSFYLLYKSKSLNYEITYRIVANASPSCFEAHVSLFRLLMKGIFDPYVL